MELGLGILGWPPEQFWKSTLRELHFAARGLAKKQGGGGAEPMSREEFEELKEKLGNG